MFAPASAAALQAEKKKAAAARKRQKVSIVLPGSTFSNEPCASLQWQQQAAAVPAAGCQTFVMTSMSRRAAAHI
jgi:hypothetical protein